LTKEINLTATPAPFMPGSTVQFTITIENQGTLDAYDVDVADYNPTGLGAATLVAGQTGVAENAPNDFTLDFVAAGTSATFEVEAVIDADFMGTSLVNDAEITGGSDVDGGADVTDVDSTPGDNATPNDVANDNDTADTMGGDDQDPAEVPVDQTFDLALIKTLDTMLNPQVIPGGDVTFTISVINQGTLDAFNVQVVDYIPSQLTLNDSDWTTTLGTSNAVLVNPIPFVAAGDTVEVLITLTVDEAYRGENQIINLAEISDADNDTDPNNPDPIDVDSNADGVNGNDTIGGDDTVNGQNGDEDDQDLAVVEVDVIFDLALTKVESSTGPYTYGSTVTFDINVVNQGTLPANEITLADYIPCGYVFDASANPNWMYDETTRIATTTTNTTLDPLTGSETLSISLQVAPCNDSDAFVNVAEIVSANDAVLGTPGDDVDSNPDITLGNDTVGGDNTLNNENGDEDDEDPAEIEVFDLALRKTIANEGPYMPGDDAVFNITVINQGNITATNFSVTDYINEGFVFNAADNSMWTLSGDQASTEVMISLAPGASTTVSITLEVQIPAGATQEVWVNEAEISAADDDNNPNTIAPTDADSTPNTNPDDDNDVLAGGPNDDMVDENINDPFGLGDDDEDDNDVAAIIVGYDLALIKTTDQIGPFAYGQVVPFDITVFNQGGLPVSNVVVSDYVPCGYLFDQGSNPGWMYDMASGIATTTISNVLAPSASTTVMINLTLQPCITVGAYDNIAEISDFDDENGNDPTGGDIDSNPDMNPDNDGVFIDDDVNGTSQGDCGQCIQTVVVPLEGVDPVVVTEIFVDGAILALPNYPYDLRDPNQAALLLEDCLALGYNVEESFNPVLQELSISVLYAGQSFDSFMINGSAEFFFSCSDCIISPDEDDQDLESIEIFDLALTKTIDNAGQYVAGDIATFDIEVFNQGNVDAYDIEVSDYLSTGYIFTSGGTNTGWSQDGDVLTFTIDGPLAPGQSTVVTLDLEVQIQVDAQLSDWYNEAEISFATADNNSGINTSDADSTPNANPDDDNNVVIGGQNDNVIDEDINDPFGLGDDDEDDNDAAGISVVGGLGDTVWKDLDGDGIQDPNEPGVEGVVATLTDCMGTVLATETTDADGFYFFNNLIPGDYQVSFDISNLPEGCTFTQQDQGGNDELDSDVDLFGFAPCTNIQGGEYDSTFDAGLLQLLNIGDFVWHDLDGDGVQDAGEPGIADVIVYLFDEDNNLVNVTSTDADGNYLFSNLNPDTYYIAFGDPDGFETTIPDATTDDNDSDVTNFVLSPYGSTTDLFTIENGQEDDLTFDAGYYMCVPIGELVWYDVDEDDIHDANENGINGLEVNLYKLVGGVYELYETQVTGHKPGTPSDDGYYKFCAPPGTYYVEVALPPLGLVTAQANQINSLPITSNSESTIDSDMTNEFGVSTTTSFTVNSGDVVCNIGSGYYPMATVGNRVWMDSNFNGIQEEEEPKVEGVTVQVFDMDGTMVGEAITNSDGEYKVEYLEKKEYYLKFEAPEGFGFTFAGQGSDDVDSDVDHSMGPNTTSPRLFNPGQDVLNIDAGIAFGVLPLDWININVERVDDQNHISWTTADEINVSHFEVEVSTSEEHDFVKIGNVTALNKKEENRYSFFDTDSEDAGYYYYRIKQVDLDGRSEYSKIVKINVENGRNNMKIYPNPAVENANISIDLISGSKALVSIFDRTGRIVRTYTINKSAENISTIIEIDNLPTGVYTVQLIQNQLEMHKKMIIIE
jgi:uncharacterized repeat protein (TIGR01451 family)